MRKRIFFIAACIIAAPTPQVLAQTPSSTSLCSLPEYKGTAIYNKYCGSAKAPASAPGGGLNPQQQMMLNATGTIMQMMIQQQQENETRERAEQAEKAAREAMLMRQQNARLEEARQRLQGSMGGQPSLTFKIEGGSSGLFMKPLDERPPNLAPPRATIKPGQPFRTPPQRITNSNPPAKPPERREDKQKTEHPEIDAYIVGEKHAGDCLPQNAGSHCRTATKVNMALCQKNYINGYHIGEARARNALRQAYDQGTAAKSLSGNKLSRPPQTIPERCGVHWIEAYNSGLAGSPFKTVGR